MNRILKIIYTLVIVVCLSNCKASKVNPDSKSYFVNTTWFYEDNSHDWTYDVTFLKDGKLKTTHPNDRTPDNDVWDYEQATITFSFNSGYSVYTSDVISKNKIKGHAVNHTGETWTWTLTRK